MFLPAWFELDKHCQGNVAAWNLQTDGIVGRVGGESVQYSVAGLLVSQGIIETEAAAIYVVPTLRGGFFFPSGKNR
jgi:hypothetical protein